MAKLSPKIILLILALLSIFIYRSVSFIGKKSIGFDEIFYSAAGYAAWTRHNYSVCLENPLLAKLWVSLPLLFLKPALPGYLEVPENHPHSHFIFGARFFSENSGQREKILSLSRGMVLIVSVIFAGLVFVFSRQIFGLVPALISFFLYTFSPNILAYSGFATTDLIMSFLLFLFVAVSVKTFRKTGISWYIYTGIILGLAFLTKFSAFILLPLMAVFIILARLKEDLKPPQRERIVEYTGIILLSAAIIVLLGYRVIHIGEYVKGLALILPMVMSAQGLGAVYLAGKYFQGGLWYYYPVVFLLKTPVPVIILIISASVSLWKRRTLVKYADLIYPLSAALVIFLCITGSRYQTGMRFLLPVLPFLFLWIGEEAYSLWQKKGWARAAVILLGLWYIASSVGIHPHYLAYFNEFTGGPKNGYKFLADCNIDWGQDLKGLKKYLDKEGNPHIVLSYFGNDDPSYYGIKFQKMAFRSRIERQGEPIESFSKEKQLLAVSATNITGVYYPGQEKFFQWLKGLKPVKRIGYSILVYDITDSAEAYEEMGKLYESQNKPDEAERAFSRMKEIRNG
ncbi:MAG: glycosyltransferase family 39 protein [bacterium]